jgi:hypothetical protein
MTYKMLEYARNITLKTFISIIVTLPLANSGCAEELCTLRCIKFYSKFVKVSYVEIRFQIISAEILL